MTLELDMRLEQHLQDLRDLRQPAARAMAEHEYLKEWCKVVKARLIEEYLAANAANKWSHARAETAAVADEAYVEALKARQAAQEQALAFRWKMDELEHRLEIWRTEQATKRVEMRAYA